MEVEEEAPEHLSVIPEESLNYEESYMEQVNRVKKALKFEQLSSKSHQRILSFLDFHNLLNCRVVSKNLKSAVDKLVESKKKDQINERWNPFYSPRGNVDLQNGEKVLGLIHLQSAAAVKQFLEKNGIKLKSDKAKKVVIKEPFEKPAEEVTQTPPPPPPKKLSTQLTQTPPLPSPPVCVTATCPAPSSLSPSSRPVTPVVQQQQKPQSQSQNKPNPPPPSIIPNSSTINNANKLSINSFKSPSKVIKPSSPLIPTTTKTTSSLSTSAKNHFKCEACLIPHVAATLASIKSAYPKLPKSVRPQSSPNLTPTKSILVKQPIPSPPPLVKSTATSSKLILKPNSKASVISPSPPHHAHKNQQPPQASPSKQANKPPQPLQVNSKKSVAPSPKPQPSSSQQVNKVLPHPQPPQQLNKPPPPSSLQLKEPKPPIPSTSISRPVIVIPSMPVSTSTKSLPQLMENPFPLGSVHIRRYIPENSDEDTFTTQQDLSGPSPEEPDTNEQIVLRTTLLVKTFGNGITSFTFDTGTREQSDLSFDQLRIILSHLPNLTFLSITAGNYEHHVDYEYINQEDHQEDDIERFPKLPHLRFISLGYNTTYHLHMDILNAYGSQLRRFTCSKFGYFVRSPFGYHVSTNNSLHKLIDYVNSIKTLYPHVLSKLEELKVPVVSSQCLMREIEPIIASGTIRLPIQWSHLKRLSLYYIHRGDGFNDCCLSDLWSAIAIIASPNLEELCLDFQACSDFIEWISSDPRPLQGEVYQPCKKMRNLYISAISLLRADDMAALVAPKFPNLENLTFFNWSLYYEEAIHGNNRQGRYYNGGPTPATIPGYIGYFWKELPVLQMACVKTETWKDEYVYRKWRNELLFFKQKEGVYIY